MSGPRERERNEEGELQEEVSTEELLDVIREHEAPALPASIIEEELPITKHGVLYRLGNLEEEGRVGRLKVGGRAVIWWPVEDEE